MKNKKLVLQKLAVKSFVIKLENDHTKSYKGGGTNSGEIPCPSGIDASCGCPLNTSMSILVGYGDGK